MTTNEPVPDPNKVPLASMKYHTYADIIAYGLTAFGGYQGVVQAQPAIAMYSLALAAVFYAVANKLASIGD